MKHIILILSFTILFLAVKPGIDVILLQYNISKQCCNSECSSTKFNKKTAEKEEQNSKEKKGKSCNPFQNCNNCVLYIASNVYYKFSKTKILTSQNFSYKTKFNSQFKPDFWQPPKIV